MQLLPLETHKRLFGYEPEDYQRQLKRYKLELGDLYDAEDTVEPVSLPLPDYCGLVENLVAEAAKPVHGYLERLEAFLAMPLDLPYLIKALSTHKPVKPGWFWFNGSEWVPVAQPDPDACVLDFETLPNEVTKKEVWWPFMAGAYSDKGLYFWGYDRQNPVSALDWQERSTLFVNHNTSYDRAFLAPEYAQKPTEHLYYDTMSAFVAVRGMSNQQRPLYKKAIKEGYELAWLKETCPNGLKDVYSFYHHSDEVLPGFYLDKGTRDGFVKVGLAWLKDPRKQNPHDYVRANWEDLATYCLVDCIAAFKVAVSVLPEWLNAQPHPVSRLAMFSLGKVWVPHGSRVDGLPERIDAVMDSVDSELSERTIVIAYELLELTGYKDLLELSTTGKSYKPIAPKALERFKALLDPQLQELDWSCLTTGKNKGLPVWLKDFLENPKPETRLGVYVLGVQWLGEPVLWVPEGRSGYWAVNGEAIEDPEKPSEPLKTIFTKGTAKLAEHVLTASRGLDAQEVLKKKKAWATWVSMRSRVHSVHYEAPEGFKVTIPTIAPTGTLTRRCADGLYQVLPNPKPDKPGTEFKSTIEAPEGYMVVGADVDSQELWLAALLGDKDRLVGSNQLSRMVLIGQKALGTDPHSVLAKENGISRDDAKTVWYGLIYGLGFSGLVKGLSKSSTMALAAIETLANKVLQSAKGLYNPDLQGYCGGLASRTFNALAATANQKHPRSPVLKAAMTKALAGFKDFGTSKTNWVVQTSGVDFRDLMLALVAYLFHREGIDGRLMMSIHDEYRYIVKEDQALKAAWLLQVAHLYTRAYITMALGLEHLPVGTSYFSAVDIDTVLRKEPSHLCQTPTQEALSAKGYSVTPSQLVSLKPWL